MENQMEANNQVTILDVLIDVNMKLRDIKVPVSELDNIGYPIAGAVNGIQACIDAIMKNQRNEQPEPVAEVSGEADA